MFHVKHGKEKMEETIYYDSYKIRHTKDLDGLMPSIHLITTNRSAGKTTNFLKEQIVNFRETGKKGALLYRVNYELSGCQSIYKDVLNLFPDLGSEMTARSMARGLFYELFLDNESFGFAFSLNDCDKLKKYSPLFADVDFIIMDEYQPENGKYLAKEIEKLQSILLTIGRGGGEQSRHLNVFLLGNQVTMLNPYYIEFNIHKRLRGDTKILRGHGWVAEFDNIESASKAIQNNAVYRAFNDTHKSDYMSYSTEDIYLHDAEIFIEKPTGKSKYLCTIIHDNVPYGVREYFEQGYLFVSTKYDPSCTTVLAFKASDHNQNTIMLNHYSYTWKAIKDAYQGGYLRFADIKAKNTIFDILAIDFYN